MYVRPAEDDIDILPSNTLHSLPTSHVPQVKRCWAMVPLAAEPVL